MTTISRSNIHSYWLISQNIALYQEHTNLTLAYIGT